MILKKGSKIFSFLLLCLFLWHGTLYAEKALLPSGEPQIERGKPNVLLDSLGYIISTPKRLLLFNKNVDTHNVSSKTEEYIAGYIGEHPEEMKDVKVRINQCAPFNEFDRLIKNHKISWWWRIFPGVPATLYSSLTGRLLGGDNYNPYTDTVSIFSDDPAIVLHEAGHAKDISGKRNDDMTRDLYTVSRMILPPVVLDQEYNASKEAIEYLKTKKDRPAEMESYNTLYSAYGTYAGSFANVPYGQYIGAAVGHAFGFWERNEARIRYSAIDNAVVGDTIIENFDNDPLAANIIKHNTDIRDLLIKTLKKERNM